MMDKLPILAGALLLQTCGVIAYLWTDRWGKPDESAAAGIAQLQRVPLKLGAWEGQDLEVNPVQLERAGCDGYFSRRYVNRSTGNEVNVLIVAGSPRFVSVHAPTACYRNLGYELEKPALPHTVVVPGSTQTQELWVGDFVSDSPPLPSRLRICWSWSASGTWQASDNPRLAFARCRMLYKLYLVRALTPAGEPLVQDPCIGLMRLLAPELQRTVFAAQD